MRPAHAAALLAVGVAASAAHGAGYRVVQAPDDTSSLTIRDAAGRSSPAPATEDDQQGYAQPRVSADGRTVGWVAETGNCCTSYPLPTVLVLWRDGKVIRRIPEVPPIWHWAFVAGRDEVVTQQAYPHGPEYFTFTRLRVSDGKVLAIYRCDQDEAVHARRPAWSRAVDVECPAYVPPPDEPAASAAN